MSVPDREESEGVFEGSRLAVPSANPVHPATPQREPTPADEDSCMEPFRGFGAAQAEDDVGSFLFDQLLQQRMQQEDVSAEERSAHLPASRDSMARLIAQQDLIRSVGGSDSDQQSGMCFPDAGDEVFGFRLRLELGRGAFARVFLAEQTQLAGRPVAVKISAIEGREPQTLARVQHTHIVPIYSVQEDERAGIRVVCMPYFGGASLSKVLQGLWHTTKNPLAGTELVQALERVAAGPPVEGPENPGNDRTPLAHFRNATYLQTVAWLIARLAEGLQHAHDRGILHRDVKPSNILLGSDGQPMLLDFNLAQNLDADPGENPLGGTVAYMAPEHLRALLGRSLALARRVDHRSDIYSLGMVLYEMIAGSRPFEHSASYSVEPLRIEAVAADRSKHAPSLRQRRLDVPWGLESIVRKSLAPEPAERYQQAEHLAEDLCRFLDNRPLRYAPELSQVERLRKWTRRHPRLTSASAVAAVAFLMLGLAGGVIATLRGTLAGAQEQLATAQVRERKGEFDPGSMRALCLVNTSVDLQEHLRQGVTVCEETLSVYGVLEGPTWREHPDWSRLPPDQRQRLAEDTRELMVLLAAARVRLASNDRQTLQQALGLLDRAEAITGLAPSRALELDRARYLAGLGEHSRARDVKTQAERIPVSSAREHYLLAAALASAGGDGYARAITELDRALALDPRHYWSWMQRGICHTELGEWTLAASDFGRCIGLWPAFAWSHFNLGHVLDQSGKKDQAVACYTRALERDEQFVPARLNRGMAQLELRRYTEALADFDQALHAGKNDARVHAGRGMALEALRRHPEADAAFQKAFAQAENLPDETRLRMRTAYGFAIAVRLPREAQSAFETALHDRPEYEQALYGLAMLAMERDKADEAMRLFTRALEVAPTFPDARRYRAILYARRGAMDRAAADINTCLRAEPRSGATLYAAACVTALALKHRSEPRLTEDALGLLSQALALGCGADKARTDPDLITLRNHPRFRELLNCTPGN